MTGWITRFSVRAQGRLLLALIFVPGVLVGYTFAAWSEWRLQHRALEIRARVIADSIAASATAPLLQYDVVGLDDVLDAIRTAPEVYADLSYAMVVDAEGRVIAHSHGYQHYGRLAAGEAGNRRAERLGEEVYDVVRPVEVGGKHWGEVRVGVDLKPLRAQLVSAWLRTAFVFLTIVAIAAFVVGQVSRRLFLRPINQLMEAMRALQRRDFSYRIVHDRKDEFGAAFDGVNRAAGLFQEREKLYATFGRYVTDQVRDAILGGGVSSKGTQVRAAVLFADLRSFTRRSENLPPEEVLDLLNRFCSRMTTAIHAHGGMVDKFIGDSVMAVFGVPVADPDCAAKAVMAASSMRNELRELNRELEAAGSEPLKMGIGIHYGACVAGSVGAPTRKQYTVVGDTVNLASRLQDLTKVFRVDVLISKEVYESCGNWLVVRDLGTTSVDGRATAVDLYELVGTSRDERVSSDAILRERERERQSNDSVEPVEEPAPDAARGRG